MAYDPKTIYKRLAELLGGVRGDPAASRGEFYDIPGFGTQRVQPVSPSGWDTSEVWQTNKAGGAPVARYKEGEIPDWMQQGIRFIQQGEGKLGADEMAGLANHWINGVGVDPGYQNAFNAQPAYVKAWLQQQLGKYLPSGPAAE